MAKIDLIRELKPLYAPPRSKIVAVEVPKLQCLMIDGKGAPDGDDYAHAIEALYTVAYTAKFTLKLGPEKTDFRVMPLETLWWADDMSAFEKGRREDWRWTALMVVPDVVTKKVIEDAEKRAAEKKPLPEIEALRLESFNEGKAAQALYLGPYSAEGPTIAAIHAYIAEAGGKLRGKHHEIYLSDPRRTAPDKLKTIIRQPFA